MKDVTEFVCEGTWIHRHRTRINNDSAPDVAERSIRPSSVHCYRPGDGWPEGTESQRKRRWRRGRCGLSPIHEKDVDTRGAAIRRVGHSAHHLHERLSGSSREQCIGPCRIDDLALYDLDPMRQVDMVHAFNHLVNSLGVVNRLTHACRQGLAKEVCAPARTVQFHEMKAAIHISQRANFHVQPTHDGTIWPKVAYVDRRTPYCHRPERDSGLSCVGQAPAVRTKYPYRPDTIRWDGIEPRSSRDLATNEGDINPRLSNRATDDRTMLCGVCVIHVAIAIHGWTRAVGVSVGRPERGATKIYRVDLGIGPNW